jgi:hypothetical protein
MNSEIVNAVILCALIPNQAMHARAIALAPSFELSREAFVREASQTGQEEPNVHIFQANDRVEILAPEHNLKLAEENEIPIRIHFPGLVKIDSQQLLYAPSDMKTRLLPYLPEGGFAVLPILYHADGSAYVKVIPRRLGQIVFEIWANFPDGGYVKTETVLTVGLPDRLPQKLIIGQLGVPNANTPQMTVYLKPETARRALTTGVVYENLKEQIQIDPAFVSFEVRTANDASIIELDKSTGSIKPLQVGEALVQTTFGGWTNLTCVVVEEQFDPNMGATQNCKSLLLPGEKLGAPIRKDGAQ